MTPSTNSMTKYNNKKIVNEWGEFDSKLEAARFIFLMDVAKQGKIRNLQRQIDFELIPNQYKQDVKQLKTKTKLVLRIAERSCHYRADFVYEIFRDTAIGGGEPYWEKVVEDTKGGGYSRGHFSTQTPDFRIKKKLMLYVHGIEVKIVTKPTQEL